MPGLSPYSRLVTRKSWTDRHGLRIWAWKALGTLTALAILVVLTLLVDLLVSRGTLPAEDQQAAIENGLLPAAFANSRDIGLWAEVVRFADLPAWSWLRVVCANSAILWSAYDAVCALVVIGLLLAILLYWCDSRSFKVAVKAARSSATWLRKSIHRQTLRLGPSDFTGNRYQSALKLFTDEVDTLREALTLWRVGFIEASLVLPTLLVAILAIDWRLGLQCLIPAFVCWWIFRYERIKGAAQRQLAEAHAETEVRFLAEGLKQTRLIRGYHMEEFEQTIFDTHLSKLTSESATGRRNEHMALSTARAIIRAGVALILLLISLRVISRTEPLPLASGVALGLAIWWFIRAVHRAESLATQRSLINISGDRIYRYLDEIPEVGQAVGAKFIDPVGKSILLETVSYQNHGHELLRGLDLRIAAKTQVALVSLDPHLPKAVAYLLPRFIEPTSGRILFDGEDIAWGTLESIRTEVAYVGNDDPSLAGTVLANLICQDQRFSMQDAMEAAKKVHVHKFLQGLPQGYDTVIGEHGEQIPPDQLFLLGLARAVLRDPAVIIIEEPQFMNEDTKSLIDDAYQRIAKDRTVIYLPGRLSTVKRCDQVVLLHDGVVAGLGKHSELSKSSELYRHWDYITFNTFSRQSRRFS